MGQAYGVAVPLQVIALALVLRGRLLSAGIVLGLLACVHLTLGAMTTAVVAAMLCWPPSVWRNWRLWAAGGIVLACALLWAFGFAGVAGSYAHVETTVWVQWERFSNSHWFPFDLGVFTFEHYFRLTPFLSLAILASCCHATELTTRAVRRGWIIALAASVMITIAGLISSLHPVSQSLVMLALHRASGITLLLLLPMAVLCLVRFLERGSIVSGALAAMALACPFVGTHGIPLDPALILAGISIFGRGNGERSRWQRIWLITLVMAAIVYVLFLVLAGHARLTDMAFIGRSEGWLVAGAFFAVRIILAIIGRWKPYPELVGRAVTIIIVMVLLWSGVNRTWHLHPKLTTSQAEAQSYLDAQIWARDNTPQHALFMPDPAHGGGWREYSRRASYGDLGNWIHTVICYRSDAMKFEEGLRRARRLGVDPEPYLARAVATSELFPGCKEYGKLFQDVRSAYYGMSGEELISLARDEGIDYFVFELKYANLFQIRPVYQNKYFAICEPVLMAHRVLAEQAFPITLPSAPVHCNELKAANPRYDWVNRGSRGSILLQRSDGDAAILQLIAGARGNKNEHSILLSPKAESENGFPVFSGAQAATFACDLRFAGESSRAGDVQLRMDVLTSQGRWIYYPRKINAGKDWHHFEAVVPLQQDAESVYPTMVWDPAADGCVLEIRSPGLSWFACEAH